MLCHQGVVLLERLGDLVSLEEFPHCGWAMRSQMLKLGPMSLLMLPVNSEAEFLVPSSAPCLPVFHHASFHANNGQNLCM